MPDNEERHAGLLVKRWEEWRRYADAQDDRELLETVNTDLPADEARGLLGDVRLREGEALPEWAFVLDEVIQAILSEDEEHAAMHGRKLNRRKIYPFEDLFLPVLDAAYMKLEQEALSLHEIYSDEACADLMERLLAELSELCGRALWVDFAVFRGAQFQHQGLMAAFKNESSTSAYTAYIASMRQGRIVDFFQQYSFLARLVATRCQYWLSSASELCRRLAEDREGLYERYDACGMVKRLQWGLSDSHQQGRTVCILEFNDEKKVVYKPKSLAIDHAFGDLIAWLEQRAVPVRLRTPKVWNRGDYGWAEWIANDPCKVMSGISAYYRNYGGLVCLVYLLSGNDFHAENIVAAGNVPVLIDLETLLHPLWIKPFGVFAEEREKEDAEFRAMMNSVFATHLLPYHELELSGLSGERGLDGRAVKLEWKNVNRDAMKVEEKSGTRNRKLSNLPKLDQQMHTVHAFIPELLDGFRQTAVFLMENKDQLLHDKVLDGFLGAHGRFLFRATFKYALLLAKILHPSNLRDGLTASIKLETLSRRYISDQVPQLLPVIDAEVKQLIEGDIPYFTIPAFSRRLEASELPLAQSALERVFSRLEQWDEREIQRQTNMIEEALQAAVTSQIERKSGAMVEEAPSLRTIDELRGLVWKLADDIRNRSFSRADDSPIWIVAGIEPYLPSFRFHPMGYGLYDGILGVSLFLMAAGRKLGDDEFAELSMRLADPVRRMVRSKMTSSRTLGIGSAYGWGSIVYGLTRLKRLSDDRTLLEEAVQAARFITPERIACDDALDMMYGSAGVIASLLTLYDEVGQEWLLELARCAGERLLHVHKPTHTGHRAWFVGEHQYALTGLSHGTAGIAYALFRLYAATGMERFKEAAEEGLRYETAVFHTERHNWPDYRGYRPYEPLRFMNSWCHGATGIGLARLGSLSCYRTASMVKDVEEAILAVTREPLASADHICCGNLGRVEMLIAAAQTLNRPDLTAIAHHQVTSALYGHADALGSRFAHHSLAALPNGALDIGFYRGISGIGYTLLRLCDVMEQQEPVGSILLLN
ncbi:type 2 lanthipeptide synthetase LanM family protein [Cohnella panacarvi]|uniref:type 2 lanthipeptide synthetase LanM family protein n=1 Tax=Cohnella panacarvi TaxID=400776 RepID=UPI000479884C|nr:type 2 lanthipeptide synthetase LanM family protein [Cohnella panacarvi]